MHRVTHHTASVDDVGQVKVTGVLADDAQLRTTPTTPPHALLFITITPARGLPYTARHDCGASAAQIVAAESKARSMRRGDPVTVYARGIQPRTDHGNAVLQLVEVSEVIAHRHQHEPNGDAHP